MRTAPVATLVATVLFVLLCVAPAAQATAPLDVVGATVQSTTMVKVLFDVTVDETAENVANYTISSAAVLLAQRTDGGYGVLLTMTPQINASVYDVTVSGVVGTKGGTMPQPETVRFIGTLLGDNSVAVGHDDFNRPSGFLANDNPYSGPWARRHVNVGNAIALVASPALLGGYGDRALWSQVTSTDGELDNAAVLHAISGTEYYTSAYVRIPSGQNWESGHAAGLLRLNQSEWIAHSRISAHAESASAFSLKVDFKSTGNAYYGEQLVATGISFDTWHWFQLRVRNSTAPDKPGVVQVWIDGRLRYSQDTIYVSELPMTYAEVGIMHNVTIPTGPPSTTITDAVRMGRTYQLPSVITDTTSPVVTVSEPAAGQSLTGDVTVRATATDNADVQRVEFRVDGSLFATDDVSPFASTLDTTQVADGAHTLTARAFDTSGNSTTSAGVAVTVANTVPSLVMGDVVPSPFSPNGDGVRDATTVSYTLLAPATTSVVVLDGADALVRILGADEAEAPGDHQVVWDGRDDGGELAPDGDYVVVAEAVTATGTTTERRTVRLDVTAPETTQDPAAGVWHTGPVDVTLSATDALSTVTGTEFDLDGLGWTAYGAPVAVAGDGVHALLYRSTDEAGNVAPATEGAVKIDGTAPVTTQAGADGAWHATDVTVTFAATDDPPAGSEGEPTSGIAAVEYRVDGNGWTVVSGGAVITAPSDGGNDGAHLVEYRAVDLAGNVEQTRSATVGIDTQGPIVSDTNDDLWHPTGYTVTLGATDGLSGMSGGAAGVEFSRDGGETWQPGVEVPFLIWKRGGGSGVHELRYRARDALGNLSAVGSTSVLMDARPPKTTDDAPRDLAGAPIPQAVDVTVHFTATDALSGVATTWYSVDGGDWVAGSAVTIPAPPDGGNDGVHWIAYFSVDSAGNAEYLRWCSAVIDALP
jgi:hypothetical protein